MIGSSRRATLDGETGAPVDEVARAVARTKLAERGF
jgi:hypothetical protein